MENLEEKAKQAYDAGMENLNRKEFKHAVVDFSKAIELDITFEDAYLARGHTKCQLGDLNGAISDATQSLELNPANADAYLARGCFYEIIDPVKAEQDFDEAIKLDPTNGLTYRLRGILRARQDRLIGALVDLNEAAKYDSENGLIILREPNPLKISRN